MINAVIFDMDGLMIDSEPLHYEAYAAVFRELGKEYPLEDNNRLYIGLSDIDEAKDMIVRYTLPITHEELVRRKQKAYKDLISTSIVPQPGLIQLLHDLKIENYNIAIASSSNREEIATIIKTLNISSFIDDYCSAEEVKHGKPAPDLFLLAAKKLKVKATDCLVLEDAPKGLGAATNAGMNVIAVPNEYTREHDFSKADMVVNSLKSVTIDLINSL
jgi:HAD superfamily hydrolase (TIGR01509 family)